MASHGNLVHDDGEGGTNEEEEQNLPESSPLFTTITQHYNGGKPLGLTFEWLNNHLEISEDHITSNNNEFESTQNNNLLPGDILISVNDNNIENLNFDDLVTLLRSLESQDRKLIFQRKINVELEMESINDVEEDEENDENHPDGGTLSHHHPPPPHSSTIHHKLFQLLTSSSINSYFHPIHCNIINLSYWYKSRQELTSKKQSAFIIQQNTQHMRYDSSLYILKVDQNDGEIKPMKKFLSSHSTRWGAYRHIENKMKERDGNPFQQKGNHNLSTNPDDILSTHYRIQIISDTFYNLNIYERLTLVYEALLQGYGKQYGPVYSAKMQEGYEDIHTCRLKSFTYVGKNVRNLPIFRFLNTDRWPLNLMIEPLTPSQWRPQLYTPPLSERYGKSHNELRSQYIDIATKPKAQKYRIKTLSTTSNTRLGSATLPLPLQESFPMTSTSMSTTSISSPHSPSSRINTQRIKSELKQSSAELLGLDSEILSQQFHKKTGGVYAHFFKDLSPGIKQMVMSKYLENKQLIQKEGARMKTKLRRRENLHETKGNTPITTMSIMKSKLEASKNMSDYDVGTNNENEMIEEYLLIYKKIEKYVIRIQRIFRLKLFKFVQRRYFSFHYAAITIQRILRGKFARLYYNLLKKIIPIAIIRIITVYRSYLTRKRMKIWYELVKKATDVLAPILKKFVKKCINKWFQRYYHAAIKIQSILRMFLAKISFYQLYGHRRYLLEYLYPSIVKIQAYYRGYYSRKYYIQQYIQLILINKIDIPSCILIQRIYRGCLGRKFFQKKKLENYSAIIIQKYLLRWSSQLYYIRLKQILLEKYCAIQIQRVYRGRLDREVASYYRHERWYHRVYIPTIIKLQSYIRCYLAKKYYIQYKLQYHSALTIQLARRCYLARCIFKQKQEEFRLKRKISYIIKIQTMIRSYLAKKKFKYLLYGLVGKRLHAAKIILRAWKNFTYRRRYDVLMAEHRKILQNKKILKLSKLHHEILDDIHEIQEDINLTKGLKIKSSERITILTNFLIESEMRMNELETFINSVTADDIAHGWGESYSLEYEMLLQQKKLSREELRLRRIEFNNLENELNELYHELEETELELDSIIINEIESYENLRQNEIKEIEKKVNRIREREVRIERCKWKIKSNRVKVIHRNRGYFNGIREKYESSRDMSYATTISHEKRAQRRDEEDIRIRREERETYKNLTKEVYRYENYAGPVQETYDDVIANSLSLLRNMTLDERVHRMQDAVHQKKKTERRRKGGLTQALKPSYREKMTNFDQMNENYAT